MNATPKTRTSTIYFVEHNNTPLYFANNRLFIETRESAIDGLPYTFNVAQGFATRKEAVRAVEMQNDGRRYEITKRVYQR